MFLKKSKGFFQWLSVCLLGTYFILPLQIQMMLDVAKLKEKYPVILELTNYSSTFMLSILLLGFFFLLVVGVLDYYKIESKEDIERKKENEELNRVFKKMKVFFKEYNLKTYEKPSFLIFASAPFSIFLTFLPIVIPHIINGFRENPLALEVVESQSMIFFLISTLIYMIIFLHGYLIVKSKGIS